MESSSLIPAVAGGNSTVSGGEEVVLDLTATVDPDEVRLYHHKYTFQFVQENKYEGPRVYGSAQGGVHRVPKACTCIA